MIEFRTGNILKAEAEALVNSVNCVGVMGRGVALQFKQAWPENFRAYAAACRRGEVQPGKMLVFETGRLTHPRYIINFPTKRHWRGKSRIEDIEAGLRSLAEEIRARQIGSIALPPLGAGLGGLNWTVVRSRIEEALRGLGQVRVIVFEPSGSPPLPKSMQRGTPPRMTVARAALIGLIGRYQAGLLDPWISLLEIHKLMYFMQEAGEPLHLQFVKGRYGPYAANLRHLLQTVEGHYISGYGAGGDQPLKALELVPGAAADAQRVLDQNPDTRARLDRVSKLIEGFESPHGLELLATVHWIVKHYHPSTQEDVVKHFYEWNRRKKLFSPSQMLIALRALVEHGWIQPLPSAQAVSGGGAVDASRVQEPQPRIIR